MEFIAYIQIIDVHFQAKVSSNKIKSKPQLNRLNEVAEIEIYMKPSLIIFPSLVSKPACNFSLIKTNDYVQILKHLTANISESQKPSYFSLSSVMAEPRAKAIVDEMIQGPNKPGRVKFQGSWWPARCSHEVALQPGQVVRVVGIHQITLLVEPLFNVFESC